MELDEAIKKLRRVIIIVDTVNSEEELHEIESTIEEVITGLRSKKYKDLFVEKTRNNLLKNIQEILDEVPIEE